MRNIYISGFEFIPAYPVPNTLPLIHPNQNEIIMTSKNSSSGSLYMYFGITFLLGILSGLAIQSSILQHGGVPLYLTMNQKMSRKD
ncbi:MAG: hypothetical protein FJX80_09800 [Bacteroidetes bacterium]|nr:hypothetical protein [Bacteroidota bacterium]